MKGGSSCPIPSKVSCIKFPDDINAQKKLNSFVYQTRKKWRRHTKQSRICSQHFQNSDFVNYHQFSMDYAKFLILKKNAISSIYLNSTFGLALSGSDAVDCSDTSSHLKSISSNCLSTSGQLESIISNSIAT